MADRVDRRGAEPITIVSPWGPVQPIGTPRATFHRGQGYQAPTQGPEIRLQSTLPAISPICAHPGESRYAC